MTNTKLLRDGSLKILFGREKRESTLVNAVEHHKNISGYILIPKTLFIPQKWIGKRVEVIIREV